MSESTQERTFAAIKSDQIVNERYYKQKIHLCHTYDHSFSHPKNKNKNASEWTKPPHLICRNLLEISKKTDVNNYYKISKLDNLLLSVRSERRAIIKTKWKKALLQNSLPKQSIGLASRLPGLEWRAFCHVAWIARVAFSFLDIYVYTYVWYFFFSPHLVFARQSEISRNTTLHGKSKCTSQPKVGLVISVAM